MGRQSESYHLARALQNRLLPNYPRLRLDNRCCLPPVLPGPVQKGSHLRRRPPAYPIALVKLRRRAAGPIGTHLFTPCEIARRAGRRLQGLQRHLHSPQFHFAVNCRIHAKTGIAVTRQQVLLAHRPGRDLLRPLEAQKSPGIPATQKPFHKHDPEGLARTPPGGMRVASFSSTGESSARMQSPRDFEESRRLAYILETEGGSRSRSMVVGARYRWPPGRLRQNAAGSASAGERQSHAGGGRPVNPESEAQSPSVYLPSGTPTVATRPEEALHLSGLRPRSTYIRQERRHVSSGFTEGWPQAIIPWDLWFEPWIQEPPYDLVEDCEPYGHCWLVFTFINGVPMTQWLTKHEVKFYFDIQKLRRHDEKAAREKARRREQRERAAAAKGLPCPHFRPWRDPLTKPKVRPLGKTAAMAVRRIQRSNLPLGAPQNVVSRLLLQYPSDSSDDDYDYSVERNGGIEHNSSSLRP
ncbi:hypothetical protein BESB_002570 [Besnoitia besnoiti]|uniref:Uncharacterized protein n=1 Tax=Besnoitia besnoiti TaxID=94643 RepID=A0A2A9MNS6_BESBE|nr:hypothetical protein BESB_002570 [Besnoitia besnoiti]PFH37916.1 hypothetical protein BESB_002570 [Besnoitia besnoiti]